METAQTEQPNDGGMFHSIAALVLKKSRLIEVPVHTSKYIYLDEMQERRN